ncbi:aminodeoxychorismate synthase component I [Ketobacter sp. MCCC 1A13808]|uniref:aminodeoxychorismate synthase component I n=1 Tax=Ketobacter sp. MCCC 1A13808 TaxID=2602738 RepID=UPI000F2A1532|nr:aminodeoxychorismate synthase component I [Ketobacter sp. MCCC 1A13808]MVF12400.1 aminodeoxychorismate synthase component I [Ketobacter sp. MCCC 1A13808]RLP55785.1 MAG: aminodeoxychorismate synthase component I [Ketobacter sp.]
MPLQTFELPYFKKSAEAFSRIRTLGNGFLLDSGHGYPDCIDIFSAAPVQIEQFTSLSPQSLQSKLKQLTLHLQQWSDVESTTPCPGWYGIWSYELAAATENVTLKTNPENEDARLPVFWMGFFPSVIITDHSNKTTRMLYLQDHQKHAEALLRCLNSAPLDAQTAEPEFRVLSPFATNLTRNQYQQRFDQVQRYIESGDCYQINLSQRFSCDYRGDPWLAYQRLCTVMSAPMGCYFDGDDWTLLSFSPERFIRHRDGVVTTQPIKGTRPRAEDPVLDQALAKELFKSEKDRAENLMIVDLLRNDLGRSCEVGSVRVEQLFGIESFCNVHHMVSTISGALGPQVSPLQLLAAAFPGGSITGAPKHRAIEIIDELEPDCRHFYCGSALYLDVCGRMDSNILIRSLLAHNGRLICHGGGGLVADSTWEQEHQEIQDKVGSILNTLQQSHKSHQY